MNINGKNIPTSKILVLLPFLACAGFLYALGRLLHLSYKQISVIFNLYLQGSILAVSGIVPACIACWKVLESPSLFMTSSLILCSLYATIYIVGLISMIKHYHRPMEYAFDLCVNDLELLASKWHVSYQAVNLIIFIAWWLALIFVNIMISQFLLL